MQKQKKNKSTRSFKQYKKSYRLSSLREKMAWDWLQLIVVPALITLIASGFALYTNYQNNRILVQREEAVKNRNQQALLIKYLDDISGLVEKQLLNLEDNSNSKTLRTIARARTLTVLRALDSDRKGELIQFLSAAQLIEADNPVIDLNEADLFEANLANVNLVGINLSGTNLGRANLMYATLDNVNFENAFLGGTKLNGATLRETSFKDAYLGEADLEAAFLPNANLERASLEKTKFANSFTAGANFRKVSRLNPTQIKSSCSWQKAKIDDKLKQKLTQEPERKTDCSMQWFQHLIDK